ncbi:hypothetical protein IU450_36180 [Nocardia abscessus]|uniref:hypothetical protein n=1 Tax=Nocardia abscessus TaxID=120957 RepID=UPI0018942E9F|nr:hypothetical protein [Nocardia abscessus]MBF6341281.1 hypothetical protein [Nocardia abscessus]
MTTFIDDATTAEPDTDPTESIGLGEHFSDEDREHPDEDRNDTSTDNDTAEPDQISAPGDDGEPRTALEVLADLEPAYPSYFADPRTLVRGPNRPEKPDDADFDADLASNGNYLPIIVSVIDGQLVVEDGWHRTRALQRAAGDQPQEKIRKAWIIALPADTDASEKQRVIKRVRLQFSTGKYRLTQDDADRLAAAAALFEVKATVKEIGANLGMSAKEVRAYRKVANSATATARVLSHQFDIFHAADADRYADDPDKTARLIQAELDGLFDHVFAEMVAEDEARAAAEAAAAEAEATRQRVAAALETASTSYADRGFVVFAEFPDDPENWLPLEMLLTATGERASEADAMAHPDAFAVVLTQRIVHAETGEPVDPDSIDDYTRSFPEATADPGLLHIRDVREEEAFEPSYFCLDLDAADLTIDPNELPADTEPDDGSDHAVDGDTGPGETIAQRYEREEREAAERAAKMNRTRVLNMKSVAAAKVRRKWIVENWFTNKKTIPAGMGALIGLTVAKGDLIDRYHARQLAAELGAHVSGAREGAGVQARDNAGLLYTAVRVVAALEADILPNLEASEAKARGWRGAREPLWADYIGLLATDGYSAAPYDRILTGELTADQVYEGVTEPAAATGTEDAGSATEDEATTDIESESADAGLEVAELDTDLVSDGEEIGGEDEATGEHIPATAA